MLMDEFIPGSKMKRDQAVVKPAPAPTDWRSNYVMKSVNGTKIPMYTIGALAEAVEKSVPTIRSWIAKGHLPEAAFRLKESTLPNGTTRKNRRLYTKEMIESLVDLLASKNLLYSARIEWSDFPDLTKEIVSMWNALITNATDKG